MLVLSRKNGESIQIGQSIEVRVLGVSGGRVKLGFSAPAEVSIQRPKVRGRAPMRDQPWRQLRVAAGLSPPLTT